MPRPDERANDALREIRFETGYIAHHPGSVLVSFGQTRVLVVCTVEDRVPHFRADSGGGWLTASYAMLPGSTHTRKRRDVGKQDGRSVEIQRLIGRAMRNVISLKKLGPRTLNIDCDVLQADGGTRTASITGAWVAVRLCLQALAQAGRLPAAVDAVLTEHIAAVSLGIVDGQVLTDLCYEEDSRADTDLNLIARGDGTLVEVQGTAEGKPMRREELDQLVDQGLLAITRLCALQREAAP